MALRQELENLIQGFIDTQAVSRGLDERTTKAYRQDLELLFRWLEDGGEERADSWGKNSLPMPGGLSEYDWEGKMEAYLGYISEEKGLRLSTVCRRYQVFGYFLSYMKGEGLIEGFRPLELPRQSEENAVDTLLTKREVDAFFEAIRREYEELDSDFRRRVCLRDQVMMGLLFYHGIEISELLRLEVSDYNLKTSVLTVRRKREKERAVYVFNQTLRKQMGQWISVHDLFENGGLYHNRMFLSKLGRPLSMKMVTNIFDKYRVMAGIEKECSPKDLKRGLMRYTKELMVEWCNSKELEAD